MKKHTTPLSLTLAIALAISPAALMTSDASAATIKINNSTTSKKNTKKKQSKPQTNHYHPSTRNKNCTSWKNLPRMKTCNIYSPSMKITIPVDIQLPYTPNGKMIYMYEGMKGTPHQGFVLPNAGKLAQTLSKTNVGIVSPMLPTDGSMQTNWNIPTFLLSGKPLAYETFYMKEIPLFLNENFGYKTLPKNQLAFGFSMGAAGGASMMLRNAKMFSGGYFLSGFYNFERNYQQILIRSINKHSGGIGSTMWSPKDYITHSPSSYMNELKTMNTRFIAGTGIINPSTGEIEPLKPATTVDKAIVGGALEAGTAICLTDFKRTVKASIPEAIRTGKTVFIQYPTGTHSWNLWLDDMYRAGGLKDILSRNGITLK